MTKTRSIFEPVIATEYEAELLEIDPGVPLMLVRRLAFDQNERCVEYGKNLYWGDRFRFMTKEAPSDQLIILVMADTAKLPGI